MTCRRLHRDPAGGTVGVEKEGRGGIVRDAQFRLRVHHARGEPGTVPGNAQDTVGIDAVEVGPDQHVGLYPGRFRVHAGTLEYVDAKLRQRAGIHYNGVAHRVRAGHIRVCYALNP